MTDKISRNKTFLTNLYAGPFPGHAIIMEPVYEPVDWSQGDFAISERPLSELAPLILRKYELMLERHDQIDDDSVPFARLHTGTEIFASAFGCSHHIFEDSPPCAIPKVQSAEEADKLETPDLSGRVLDRIFEMGSILRDRLGPDVPIGIADIQSPFDIAALIWSKEDLFVSMHTDPDAVHRLVDKCHSLLRHFLSEFKKTFPNCNLCACPDVWTPPELGCYTAEDEVGSMSTQMFETFCLPRLQSLSEEFGGLFMHCCAAADHQYASFRKIPNLRSLNRVFQEPGFRPAIEAFAGHTVLAMAWFPEETMHEILDQALPHSRFLFHMTGLSLDEAKAVHSRLRERCPRQ